MKKIFRKDVKHLSSLKLLFSYLVIILAPAIAIVVIYTNMQQALIDIQAERVKGLTKEAAVVFDNEIDQLTNIGKYIIDDGNLKHYIQERPDFDPAEVYFRTFELAGSYPNFSLMNHFVKYVYILPEDSSYMIRIPQVIPEGPRESSVLDVNCSKEKNINLLKEMADGKSEGIRFFLDSDGDGSIWILHKANYREGTCAVLVDMNVEQLNLSMKNILGKNEGIVFLTDIEGDVLSVYDNLNHTPLQLRHGLRWDKYLDKSGWKRKDLHVNSVSMDHNKWKFITVVPQKALLSGVRKTHDQILFLCIISLLVGVLICLFYWNNSRPVVQKYIKLVGEDSKRSAVFHGVPGIWNKLGELLERMDVLQSSIQKQKKFAKEEIWKKILLGAYSSDRELKQEMGQTDLPFQMKFPCYVIGIEMDLPTELNTDLSENDFISKLKKILEIHLNEYENQIVAMGALNYTLIISMEAYVSKDQIKTMIEKINYALYSKMPLNIYSGISDEAHDLKAVSEQYENVQRICEYAKYYKIRLPLILNDIPRNQNVVFTVDLELQLEKVIESGIYEQLRILMDQIIESNLKFPEQGCQSMSHTVEIIRSVVLRCLDQEPCGQKRNQLFSQTQRAKTTKEIEEIVFDTCSYFTQKKAMMESEEEERLKNKIIDVIGQKYRNGNFNLTILSEKINISEQKLYRDFQKLFGVSFASYLEMQRISSAEAQLKKGKLVQEVAEEVGYNSDYSFRRAFKRVTGVTPSEYQKMYG